MIAASTPFSVELVCAMQPMSAPIPPLMAASTLAGCVAADGVIRQSAGRERWTHVDVVHVILRELTEIGALNDCLRKDIELRDRKAARGAADIAVPLSRARIPVEIDDGFMIRNTWAEGTEIADAGKTLRCQQPRCTETNEPQDRTRRWLGEHHGTA